MEKKNKGRKEREREKEKERRKEQSISESWDNFRWPNICVIRVPERQSRIKREHTYYNYQG